MNWFKLHHEARNDAKLRTLTDAQHRIWFNLLCYASEQSDRGSISYDDPELLAIEVSNGDVDALRDTLTRLVKLQIVSHEEGLISFFAWDNRQHEKPSAKPERVSERVRKHRAKRETPGNTGETPCNTLVTPSNAIEQSRADSEQTENRADSEQQQLLAREEQRPDAAAENAAAARNWWDQLPGARDDPDRSFLADTLSQHPEWVAPLEAKLARGSPRNRVKYAVPILRDWLTGNNLPPAGPADDARPPNGAAREGNGHGNRRRNGAAPAPVGTKYQNAVYRAGASAKAPGG